MYRKPLTLTAPVLNSCPQHEYMAYTLDKGAVKRVYGTINCKHFKKLK